MFSIHRGWFSFSTIGCLLMASSGFAITLGHEAKDGEFVVNPPSKGMSAVPTRGEGGGYVYMDSEDPEGPVFSWVDISDTGIDLGLSDDSSSDRFEIGFPFLFYGREYHEINVASNGVVYFGTDTYFGLSNLCLPAQTGYGDDTNTLVAGFWDDLVPEPFGENPKGVLYQVLGEAPTRRLVIMWDRVPRFGLPGTLSFEIILDEADGGILLQYLNVNEGVDGGGSATVGIEDLQSGSGSGLEYLCNNPDLSDGLAIRFAPKQLPAAIPALAPGGAFLFLLLLSGVAWIRLRR